MVYSELTQHALQQHVYALLMLYFLALTAVVRPLWPENHKYVHPLRGRA
jgi:hypothetical protein